MGNSSSSSTKSSVFMEAITKAFMKNITKCMTSITLVQTLDIIGDGNNVSDSGQVQVQQYSVSCDQNTQAMADFQNKMADAIQQEAKNQDVAVLNAFGNSSSQVSTNIHNSVKNVLTLENVQAIFNEVNQKQGINIRGNNNIIRNFTQEQSLKMVATSAQKVLAQISAVANIVSQLDQKSSNTVENPVSQIIDSVGDAFSKIWDSMWAPLKWFLIIFVVGIVAYMIMGNPLAGTPEVDKYAALQPPVPAAATSAA